LNVKAFIDREFHIGTVDPRLAASHVEHAGRCVYDGIYEPDHPLSDEDGFRTDVIEAVKELGTTAVRYPGGNFVSGYYWKDGIGPKENRPVRPELAWKTFEPNQVGIDEFMRWRDKAGGFEPMLTVNLGSLGMKEAAEFLEYCNMEKGTYYSDLRRSYGHEEPYAVKTWCLGNEMDGSWQLGGLSGKEYGRKAANAAFAMRSMCDGLELILCGSSGDRMENYPEFMREALDEAYGQADLVSLHRYFGESLDEHRFGSADFLASAAEIDAFIRGSIATIDYVKTKKRSSKTVNISLDEWNVWPKMGDDQRFPQNKNPWMFPCPITEGSLSFEDFLLSCFYNLTVLRHCDRVKIFCIDLLVNTCGPVMTVHGGKLWRQPTYYLLQDMASAAGGTALQASVKAPSYSTERFRDVPVMEAVPVFHPEKEELTVFCACRSMDEDIELDLDLRGFEGYEPVSHTAMASRDLALCNSAESEPLFPREVKGSFRKTQNGAAVSLSGLSWNVLRFRKV